jgi:hypothetical protein
MERILRHDGAMVPPCAHCGRKPRYVVTQSELPDMHRLECPNDECCLSTGEHNTLEEAQQEWEWLMGQ